MKKLIFVMTILSAISCSKKSSWEKLNDIEGDMYNGKSISAKKEAIDEYFETADEYFHKICKDFPNGSTDHVALNLEMKKNISFLESSGPEIMEYYWDSIKKYPALERLFYQNQVDCSLK